MAKKTGRPLKYPEIERLVNSGDSVELQGRETPYEVGRVIRQYANRHGWTARMTTLQAPSAETDFIFGLYRVERV